MDTISALWLTITRSIYAPAITNTPLWHICARVCMLRHWHSSLSACSYDVGVVSRCDLGCFKNLWHTSTCSKMKHKEDSC